MHKSLKINRLYGFFFHFLVVLAVLVALNGCTKEEKFQHSKNSFPLQYAKNFQLDSLSQGLLGVSVRVFLGKDTIQHKYLFLEKNKAIPKELSTWKVIRTPVEKIVVMSGSHYAYLKHLKASDRVIGFGNKNNTADSILYHQIESGNIKDVGEGPHLKQEQLYNLQPDVIIAFATGGAFDSNLEKLEAMGIPVLYVSEWQEPSALGKLEWLYLFESLVQTNVADNLFKTEQRKYEAYRNLIKESNLPCHKVLLGSPVSGYWFAPGDLSYTGSLISDAGGCSVFPKDSSLEKRFSLESVFLFAENAETWLHPGYYKSMEELFSAENRIQHLKPYKNRRIFNFDKKRGPSGALDFYENAVLYPSEVLLDLINILHPEASPKKNTTWYRNIFYN